LGSFWVFYWRLKPLKSAGGRVAIFLPILRIPFFGYTNLRNHRKMIIADGDRAIIGGMNLAEEYLGPIPNSKTWVDLSLLVTGAAVDDLTTIFRNDWSFASGESLRENKLSKVFLDTGASRIQVVGSGPDVSSDPLYDSILSAVFSAEKRIWIATPYFIPDELLSKALELAARRGVDVRLLTPKHSDHFFADLCRGSYLKQLNQAGGQIYFYGPRMMHAKVTLIDDSYAVVGSANMDMRSLLINYEIGVFLYSPEVIQGISDWFLNLQNGILPGRLKRNRGTDLLDGLGRILGPMF
jgi:cardiolipin synthase